MSYADVHCKTGRLLHYSEEDLLAYKLYQKRFCNKSLGFFEKMLQLDRRIQRRIVFHRFYALNGYVQKLYSKDWHMA